MSGILGMHAVCAEPNTTAQVVRVVDGDTVWVVPAQPSATVTPTQIMRLRKRDASWQKIRIEGIDAPEICQPYGDASRRALLTRVLMQMVEVEPVGIDQYGRTLARLYLNGEDVGRQQVLTGQAWSYRRLHGNLGSYAIEEGQAAQQRLGLFADPAAEYPADFRRREGSCYAPPQRAGRPWQQSTISTR